MKYVQINSFYNGSTGTIMRNLHQKLQSEGYDSYIFWGRRHETISDHERCIASGRSVNLHGVRSRITDRAGFYSKGDTKRLLKRLTEIDPDVIHLHNIHGYYLDVSQLFEWLAGHRCDLKWTLHDCWAFTGHCPHFEYIGCDRWKNGCYQCPQRKEYPASVVLDRSERNWQDKKRLFTLIPQERMTLITPSSWLAGLVAQSFLSEYTVEVVPNQVNREVFRPIPSDVKSRMGIGDSFVILGVASPWSPRKGLSDFVALRQHLEPEVAIVLVGLTKKQIAELPEGIVGIERTDSQRELVELYSAADVFFNPTYEDNFPTVNLEAEACGVPVVTYNAGGCAETIGKVEGSIAVPDFSTAVAEIHNVKKRETTSGSVRP